MAEKNSAVNDTYTTNSNVTCKMEWNVEGITLNLGLQATSQLGIHAGIQTSA